MLSDYIDQDDVSGVDGGEKETYQEPGRGAADQQVSVKSDATVECGHLG